ncbi:hypothetical protein E2C01_027118 [Portunus trituberculatus]|uniref:Uncharacterized protein n=1 Tax=Portunus trituberculatus TaxID=210409 RepID=A0A5B7EKH8_PORTR|nr:hypothetical protein [Portunus trituberculatus]
MRRTRKSNKQQTGTEANLTGATIKTRAHAAFSNGQPRYCVRTATLMKAQGNQCEVRASCQRRRQRRKTKEMRKNER